MPVAVEASRYLGRWARVDLGPLPYNIKSNISNASQRYVIAEDEDGVGALVITLSPSKDKLSALIPSEFGRLFDIELEELERGKPIFIEGILPGNTKSEFLRLTQE